MSETRKPIEVINTDNPVDALLKKLEGIENGLNLRMGKIEQDLATEVQNSAKHADLTEKFDGLAADLADVQTGIAAFKEVQNSSVDEKTLVLQALHAGMAQGYVAGITQEVVNATDANLLRAENLKKILPDLNVGTDMTTIFDWQPCDGKTGRVGGDIAAALATGDNPTAAASSATAKTVTLFDHHHYVTIPKSDAALMSVSWAAHNAGMFLKRRNRSLKAEFVSGNGTTQMKGIEQYTVTNTITERADGKLYGLLTGAAKTISVAQFRAAVLEARFSIGEDAVPVVMMRSERAASCANDTADNVAYWKDVNGKSQYCGCEVVINDELTAASASTADNICAVVMAKGHAYAGLYNDHIEVGNESAGGNVKTYMGQTFGGDIADLNAITVIQAKTA